MLNQDFKEMLLCLKEENVEFIIVGAYALAAHGYPRVQFNVVIARYPLIEVSRQQLNFMVLGLSTANEMYNLYLIFIGELDSRPILTTYHFTIAFNG
jgi:predicted SpoU family rRNA methylase